MVFWGLVELSSSSELKVPPIETTLAGNAGYIFFCVWRTKFTCTVHHVRLNGNNSLFSLFLFTKKPMPAIKLNECSVKAENLCMQSDVGTTSILARY